jgi:hypothetical protein
MIFVGNLFDRIVEDPQVPMGFTSFLSPGYEWEQACSCLEVQIWRKRKLASLALRLACVPNQGDYCMDCCIHKIESMLLLTVHFRLIL